MGAKERTAKLRRPVPLHKMQQARSARERQEVQLVQKEVLGWLSNLPKRLVEDERLDAAIDYLLEYGEWDSATVEVFGHTISIG